jgi:EAL domain-containing protein (putative c-di-GMP-specific phosphodiesterase class I)
LCNLPVDIVKIDKSFIDRLTLNGEGAAVVRSVIDLSNALGLTTVAEGVEHNGQHTALDAFGCDCIQGFLFAKPMPAAAMAQLLSSGHDYMTATGAPNA